MLTDPEVEPAPEVRPALQADPAVRAVFTRLDPLRSCDLGRERLAALEREALAVPAKPRNRHYVFDRIGKSVERLFEAHDVAHGPPATFTLTLRSQKVLLTYDAPFGYCRKSRTPCG